VSDQPLRVSLVTHGGLAAGFTGARAARVVDTGRLAPADAAHLRRLLRAAQRGLDDGARSAGSLPAPPPSGSPASPSPGAPPARPADVVTYRVRVEPAGPVLSATDLDLSDDFADLVDFIEEHAGEG